jgi:hypothetical protein
MSFIVSFIDSLIPSKDLMEIVLVLTCLNTVMTAAKNILDRVAANSAADSWVGKICSTLSTVLGYVSANHANAAAKQATPK